MANIWEILGIAPTDDNGEIRRAYARRLKTTNPEDDPEGFKALREAYEAAVTGKHVVILRAPLRPPEAAEPRPRPPEPPRPAPPPEARSGLSPDPRLDHARRQANLEHLLRQSVTNEKAILAAYEAVMTSPAMDMLDVEASTEDWLAALLPNHCPQSDPLIPLAITRFNWRDNSFLRRLPCTLPWFFRREHDLGFVRNTRQWGSPHFTAWQALSKPYAPLSLWSRLFSPQLAGQIANLLNEIHAKHPTAIANLNSQAVEAWYKWFDAGPHLLGKRLWAALAAAPLFLIFLLGWYGMPWSQAGLSLIFAVPAGFAVLLLLGQPRAWWRARRDTAPPWQTFGWLPLLIATLAVASIPGLWLSPLPVLIPAVAALIWAGTVSDDSAPDASWVDLLFGEAALAIWALSAVMMLPQGPALQFATATLAAVFAGVVGSPTLHGLYKRLPQWGRLAAIATAVLSSIGAVALMAYSVARPDWRPAAVSAVIATSTLYRPLCSQSPSLWFAARVAILVGMLAWTWPEGPAEVSLIGGGVWAFLHLARAVTELKEINRKSGKKRPGLA